MKSEPETFGIEHLERDGVTPWEGVRNFVARNYMKEMGVGDRILFYHSSTGEKGVYGVAKVAALAHPDMSQFDKKGDYYEAKATKEKPYWWCVDVAFVFTFKRPVLLPEIKLDPKLAGMILLHSPRLSVQPVSETHFQHILDLSK